MHPGSVSFSVDFDLSSAALESDRSVVTRTENIGCGTHSRHAVAHGLGQKTPRRHFIGRKIRIRRIYRVKKELFVGEIISVISSTLFQSTVLP